MIEHEPQSFAKAENTMKFKIITISENIHNNTYGFQEIRVPKEDLSIGGSASTINAQINNQTLVGIKVSEILLFSQAEKLCRESYECVGVLDSDA